MRIFSQGSRPALHYSAASRLVTRRASFPSQTAGHASSATCRAFLSKEKRRQFLMIFITGPGGTVGSEVVKKLESLKVPFRAGYHSEDKVKAARAKGIDAVVINYDKPETLQQGFAGCSKVFLLGPNVQNQAQLETNAVTAAKAAGVSHIVKLSVLRADEEQFQFSKVHRSVEKGIESSGVAWTFLRPNSFMQNVINYMGATIKAENAFYSAAGDGRISHVDVRDIAAVAAKALTEPGHERKAYALTGPEAITYDEMAAQLSKVLGKPVTHVKLTPDDYRNGMLAVGTPEWFADLLLDLERFYREEKASIISDDIKNVTGKDPIRFEQFAREYASSL